MIQINLNGGDNNIILNIEANTIIPGSYISAAYTTEAIGKTIISDLNESIDEYLLKLAPPEPIKSDYITNTKIISTREDIDILFTPADNKYFVTGVTDTKFNIIDKYFNKVDLVNIGSSGAYKTLSGDVSGNTVELTKDAESNELIRVNKKFTLPGLNISAMILKDKQDGTSEYVLYLDTENPIKYVDLGNGLSIFTYMREHNQPGVSPNLVLYDNYVDEPEIISEVFIDRGLNSAFERTRKLKNVKNINELSKMGLGYYKINNKGYNFKNI